jgi:hypothetical protein
LPLRPSLGVLYQARKRHNALSVYFYPTARSTGFFGRGRALAASAPSSVRLRGYL